MITPKTGRGRAVLAAIVATALGVAAFFTDTYDRVMDAINPPPGITFTADLRMQAFQQEGLVDYHAYRVAPGTAKVLITNNGAEAWSPSQIQYRWKMRANPDDFDGPYSEVALLASVNPGKRDTVTLELPVVARAEFQYLYFDVVRIRRPRKSDSAMNQKIFFWEWYGDRRVRSDDPQMSQFYHPPEDPAPKPAYNLGDAFFSSNGILRDGKLRGPWDWDGVWDMQGDWSISSDVPGFGYRTASIRLSDNQGNKYVLQVHGSPLLWEPLMWGYEEQDFLRSQWISDIYLVDGDRYLYMCTIDSAHEGVFSMWRISRADKDGSNHGVPGYAPYFEMVRNNAPPNYTNDKAMWLDNLLCETGEVRHQPSLWDPHIAYERFYPEFTDILGHKHRRVVYFRYQFEHHYLTEDAGWLYFFVADQFNSPDWYRRSEAIPRDQAPFGGQHLILARGTMGERSLKKLLEIYQFHAGDCLDHIRNPQGIPLGAAQLKVDSDASWDCGGTPNDTLVNPRTLCYSGKTWSCSSGVAPMEAGTATAAARAWRASTCDQYGSWWCGGGGWTDESPPGCVTDGCRLLDVSTRHDSVFTELPESVQGVPGNYLCYDGKIYTCGLRPWQNRRVWVYGDHSEGEVSMGWRCGNGWVREGTESGVSRIKPKHPYGEAPLHSFPVGN